MNIESMTDAELLAYKKELESSIAMNDARQMAMKIAINSLYGAMGNVGFRYYDLNIAEGITHSGQLASRYMGEQIHKYLNLRSGLDENSNEVDWLTAGDTDSLYLSISYYVEKILNGNKIALDKRIDLLDAICETELTPFIAEKYESLAQYMNAYENKMSMKREAISDVGIWRAKKNYVLRVYDNEGVRYASPKIKMMGIETARSEMPEFVKHELEECIKLMLDNDKEHELQQRIQTFKTKFMKADVNDLARNKGVNGIEDWSVGLQPKHRAPFNVCAALAHNRMLIKTGNRDIKPIESGDKVKIISLTMPNPAGYHYFAYATELPSEFGLHQYIDRQGQFEKLFLDPVKSFTNLLGWNVEASSIGAYF